MTWRFSWKSDYTSNDVPITFCDQNTINNNELIGEGEINIGYDTDCDQYPSKCFDARIYCNDFSMSEVWSSGTNTKTITSYETSFFLQ